MFVIPSTVHMNIRRNLVAVVMKDISDSLCFWFSKRVVTRILLAARPHRTRERKSYVKVAIQSHPRTFVLRRHVFIPQWNLENTCCYLMYKGLFEKILKTNFLPNNMNWFHGKIIYVDINTDYIQSPNFHRNRLHRFVENKAQAFKHSK